MPHINWSKKVKICIRLTNMETVRVPVWVYVVCHIQRQCSWWHHWWPLQRPINGPTVSRSHCLGLTDKGNRGKGRCDCLMDNLFNNKWSHSTMFIGSKILFTFCYNTETKMTLLILKNTHKDLMYCCDSSTRMLIQILQDSFMLTTQKCCCSVLAFWVHTIQPSSLSLSIAPGKVPTAFILHPSA